MQLKKSQTARNLLFFMALSTDHITGATGKTVTVTISKNGGAFASPSGAVSEIANGWYQVAGNATDSNTSGSLILHATASGCDPADKEFEVQGFDPDDAVHLGLSALPNVASGSAGAIPTTGTGANQINVDGAGAVDANTKKWAGTAVAATVTAGVPVVDSRDVIRSGTAQAGTTNTITLDASASATTDFYKGDLISIIGGTGAGEPGVICTAYNGSTKVASCDQNFTVTPDNTSVFKIERAGVDVRTWEAVAPNALVSGDVPANTKQIAGAAVSATTAQIGVSVRDVNGNTTAASNLKSAYDGTTGFDGGSGTLQKVDVRNWNGSAPNNLVSGRIDAIANALGAAVIASASFATDALDSNALAASAATEIANAVKAAVIESNGSITLQQCLSIALSALAGVTANNGLTLKDPSGTSTRIAATVDGSNDRTAMTLTPSS